LRNLLRRGPATAEASTTLAGPGDAREALRRGNLDGAVTRAQQLLDQALAAEREELRRPRRRRRPLREAMLDNLPRSHRPGGRELCGLPVGERRKRSAYQQILDQLRQEMVDHRSVVCSRRSPDPAARRPARR
jgi:uncharacterized protein with von Willebrand factor type A (vWA) domain